MKLDHLRAAARVAAVVGVLGCVLALGTGCSSGAVAQPAKSAVVSDASAITQLMSAQLPGPTPRVGKARLANDDVDTTNDVSELDGESAPKSVRRSDGSRRQGAFGTTK